MGYYQTINTKKMKSENKYTLLDFIKRESKKSHKNILGVAAVSGIANALVLGIINSASKVAQHEEVSFQYLVLFMLSLTLFIITERYILKNGAIIMEGIVDSIRKRLADKIRKADLLSLENIGPAQIYNRLTNETTAISQSAGLIVATMQSVVMLIFVVFYMAYLSITAFVLIVILLIAGIGVYLRNEKILKKELRQTNQTEIKFFDTLTSILEGIKEIKFNKNRSDEIYSSADYISTRLKNLKISSSIKYAQNYIFSQSFFFVSIAVIVFILPRLELSDTDVITQSTAAILFMIGPVSNIAAVIPVMNQVSQSINHIYELEDQINKIQDTHLTDSDDTKFHNFNNISIKNLEFTFPNGNGSSKFSIGPIDLDIKKGEKIFVVGGNGSGKTTFIKNMTKLYQPDSGEILIDGEALKEEDICSYRELFSGIFAEFHLFRKLYGLSKIDKERVNELLTLMEIEHKTKYMDGAFTNLDLSTGQRKRLALVVTMLEDKPICIFDEWAADQDPIFRQFFYETLLDKLISQGKTVIAVSHDDRYFGFADKVIKMEYGKIIEVLDNTKLKS